MDLETDLETDQDKKLDEMMQFDIHGPNDRSPNPFISRRINYRKKEDEYYLKMIRYLVD